MTLKSLVLKRSGLRLLFQLLSELAHLPVRIVLCLVPRKKRLWVFAHRHGYTDNAREVFEYASNNLNGVEAVWLAQDKSELASIPDEFRAVVRSDFSAISYISRAESIFISTGFGDVPRFSPLLGTRYYQLWHGWPIKRIGLLSKETYPFKSRIAKSAMRLALKIQWSRITAFFCHDEAMKQIVSKAFSLPKEKCIITGWPRFESKRGPHCEADKKVLLYVPTWHKDSRLTNHNVNGLLSNKFLDFLRGEGIDMIIKLHPLDMDNFAYESVTGVTFSDENPLKLVEKSDFVVSDFSSLLVDAVVRDKKIFLYGASLSNYFEERGLNSIFIDDYENLYASDVDKLMSNIRNDRVPNWNFYCEYGSSARISNVVLSH